ncbi:MAG: secretin N-terminal domain-containing protein [bacterium]
MNAIPRAVFRRASPFALAWLLTFAAALPGAAETGKPFPGADNVISVNLKGASVVDVFRLIAEQNNINVLVSPDVQGTITLHLTDITVAEVMDVVLEASNAKMQIDRNIVRIVPRAEKPAAVEGEPLITEIIPLRYANSERLVSILQQHISERGRIQTYAPGAVADARKPKTLIVTDTPESIDAVRRLIESLDVEVPQVLIESKMVETALGTNDIFGVSWNVAASFSGPPFRTDTDLAEGGKIRLGTLSLSQFSAALEVLKKDNSSNILSDVKIATSDGETANVHVGESIPVGLTGFGAGGAGTVIGTTGIQSFETGIKLKVTPTVIDNNKVFLHIQPEISTVTGFTSLGGLDAGDAPVTNTRTAETNVIVRSGDTVVIAGLLQETLTENREKVPVVGDLPIVGPIFRKKTTDRSKTNLFIFITAHIMEPFETPPERAGKPESKTLDDFLEYK